MAEWHVPFHVFEQDWTEQQFQLMTRMLMDRRRREQKAIRHTRGRGKREPEPYR